MRAVFLHYDQRECLIEQPLGYAKNIKGDLHGTTFSHATGVRQDLQQESRRVNQPTTFLRQTRARVNGAKSCRRPVVSLSHERKSYRVNRPLDCSLTITTANNLELAVKLLNSQPSEMRPSGDHSETANGSLPHGFFSGPILNAF